MPLARILRTDAFEDQLMEIASDRIIIDIENAEDRLMLFPDMGSPLVAPSLEARFGSNLRKLIVDSYVLVYRHDEDAVRMLAAIPGRAIQ